MNESQKQHCKKITANSSQLCRFEDKTFDKPRLSLEIYKIDVLTTV